MFNLFTVFSLVVSLDLPKTHNTASYRKFINCIKELSLCIISLYCSAWPSFCLSIYCLIYIICFVCFAISLRLYSYGQRVFVKDTEILNKKKCTIFPAYSLVLEVQGVPRDIFTIITPSLLIYTDVASMCLVCLFFFLHVDTLDHDGPLIPDPIKCSWDPHPDLDHCSFISGYILHGRIQRGRGCSYHRSPNAALICSPLSIRIPKPVISKSGFVSELEPWSILPSELHLYTNSCPGWILIRIELIVRIWDLGSGSKSHRLWAMLS